MRIALQIAWNSFREILREPVYLLVTLSALLLIALLPMMTLFVFREQVKMVVDSAMATVMVFGWVLAVLCAANAITREIARGTAMAVLAKPVPRVSFILGKVIGVLLALLVFWGLTVMASMISIRAATDQFRFDQTAVWICFGSIALACLAAGIRNYLSQVSFAMNVVVFLLLLYPLAMVVIAMLGAGEGQRLSYAWDALPAFVLVLYAVWAMGGLAIALSTRVSMLVNLNVCAVVFLVGLMSDYLLGRHAPHSLWARIGYAVVPNWQLLWLADALAADRVIPAAYMALATVYLLCLLAIFVGLAAVLFQTREVGSQNIR